MTHQPYTHQEKAALHEVLREIPGAVTDAEAWLGELSVDITALTGTTCNGTIYYQNNQNMFVNHSVAQTCPIHGEPPANGRLRKYVGKKPEKQAAALKAIADHKRLTQLHQHQADVISALRRSLWSAKSLISYLRIKP